MNIKKLTAFALAGVLCLSAFAGCAGKEGTENETNTSDKSDKITFSYDLTKYLDENGFIKGLDTSAVKLVDYKALAIPADKHTPSEETIRAHMLYQLPSTEVTEGVVSMGDTVYIDYVGTVDGVEFQGGKATNAELTLGSNKFIPGFETQVAGHEVGENFDIYVTFPDGYSEELSNKDAVFNITINSYLAPIEYDELTDEFVKENLSSVGIETIEALREYSVKTLTDGMVGEFIYENIFNASELDAVPQQAIDMQAEYMLTTLELQAMSYGITLEDYLSMVGGMESAEVFRTEMADTIEAAARELCISQAIAVQEGFTVTEEDMKNYFGGEDYTMYAEAYGEQFVKFIVMQSKTLNYLKDNTPRL